MKVCLAFILETTCMCKVYTYLQNGKGKVKIKKKTWQNKRTKPRKIIKVAKLKGEPSGTLIKERLNFSPFFGVQQQETLTGHEKNPLQGNNLQFVRNVREDNLGTINEIHFLKLKEEGEIQEADGESV